MTRGGLSILTRLLPFGAIFTLFLDDMMLNNLKLSQKIRLLKHVC